MRITFGDTVKFYEDEGLYALESRINNINGSARETVIYLNATEAMRLRDKINRVLTKGSR